MELPGLGESCQATSCKQLDFLPMKCDACGKIFCRDHIHYNTHECPESYKKDNQVPVCPLCNSPIAVKKGELPDVIVGRHIDNDCQSDLAKKRRKIYTNRCSFKGCKHKELIPVNCDKCHQNFCLKHRHELDHQCKGFEETGRGVSRAAAAAVNRASTSNQPKPSSSNKPKSNQGKPQNTMLAYIGKDLARDRRERQSQPTANNTTNSVQGGMSEDEALAHAIQMSMQESQPPAPQKPLTREEEEDLLLAQAIAASQQEAQAAQRRQQEAQQNKRSCSLS